MVGRVALLMIVDHLRRKAAHLDLRAHLLQARSKRFNLLLLPRESGLKVLLRRRRCCAFPAWAATPNRVV